MKVSTGAERYPSGAHRHNFPASGEKRLETPRLARASNPGSGTPADPLEVDDAAIFLAADESRYVTGTELVIDVRGKPRRAEVSRKPLYKKASA